VTNIDFNTVTIFGCNTVKFSDRNRSTPRVIITVTLGYNSTVTHGDNNAEKTGES
jgi:hypothetical protein